MAQFLRACVVLLIALVAAWSMAQAAGLATARHDMAGLASHHEHPADGAHCHDCDLPGTGDGSGALCQIACVSPIAADPSVGAAPAIGASITPLHVSTPAADLHGRSDPPDPFPPRVHFLT